MWRHAKGPKCVWCVAKVGMHDFIPKADLVRDFLAISRKDDRFSRNGLRCRLRNDAAINFCHINFFIWSPDEGVMTDSLKLSSMGRSLRTIPVFSLQGAKCVEEEDMLPFLSPSPRKP